MGRRFRVGAGIVALALLAAPAGPAAAHWQYTKWGMSPEQVVAASKGAAMISAGDSVAGGQQGSSGTYRTGEYEFATKFFFTDARLTVIWADLQNSSTATCYRLQQDLRGLYGVPEQMIGAETSIWTDRKNGNFVAFNLTGYGPTVGCRIVYKPSVSTKGL